MISYKQIQENLIQIYLDYLDNPKSKSNRKKALEVYAKYANGADTIFGEEISKAIWCSFDLAEEKLSKKDAKRILENLRKENK